MRITTNVTPADTTQFLHDRAGPIVAETDAFGATQCEYIWLDDLPLAVVANVSTTPAIWAVRADQLDRPIFSPASARRVRTQIQHG